jgi:hypothetical protein
VLLNDLALTVAASEDYASARTFAEEALEALRAAKRTKDTEYGRIRANLGLILLHQKEWKTADAEAISIRTPITLTWAWLWPNMRTC